MKYRAYLLPRAELDQAEIYNFLAQTSAALAQRFLESVAETLEDLRSTSLPGMAWISDHPRLSEVRWSSVRGFKNYLLIFRLDSGRLEVIRMVHGARDIETLLRAPT